MATKDALRTLANRGAPVPRRRRWRTVMSGDAFALLGGTVLLALAVAAILAPRLAPYTTAELEDMTSLQLGEVQAHAPPFWDRRGDTPCDSCDVFEERYLPYDPRHVLGTDQFGRDMLSLLLYGTRYSLAYGLLTVALITAIGAAVGLAAGWRGGVTDYLAMRAADVVDAVPAILGYILFATVASGLLAVVLGPLGLRLGGIPVTALVLSSVGWVPVARLVRGQVLALKGEEWVLAARAVGVPGARIALRHLLPHAVGPALVAATTQLPVLLVVEGLLYVAGIEGRSGHSLGLLIIAQFYHTVEAPYHVLMPTAVLVAIALAATALSDGVERVLDPAQANRVGG